VNQYGVHFDPKLRDEVVARYVKLDIPTYWHGVNAELTKGKTITITYPRDFRKQRLGYAAMYRPELLSH
jgi:dipeptidyl-peptidase-3